MFALVLMALLILLAIASLAVLADSGLRWWSAFGALKRQLANRDPSLVSELSSPLRRNIETRPIGSRQLTRRVALRAAA